MAVTQHDSIFPDISLPGGISSKATEFKEIAAKGEKWESPVFGIGSASPSTDIPDLAPVTRKPHNTASGGVRGSGLSSGGGNLSSPGNSQNADATAHGYNQSVGGSGANAGAPGYGPANGNPSGGFSNQVDQAFGMKDSQANGPHAGIHSAVTAGH